MKTAKNKACQAQIRRLCAVDRRLQVPIARMGKPADLVHRGSPGLPDTVRRAVDLGKDVAGVNEEDTVVGLALVEEP